MITFVVVASLMVLMALAFVLVPLLRQRRENAPAAGFSTAASNLAVFKSQRREIDDDFARGAIDATERDAAVAELARRLLDEVPSEATAQRLSAGRPWLLTAATVLLLPVAAAAIYAGLGTPAGLAPGTAAQAAGASHAGAAPGEGAPMSDAKILEMVDTLARKMEQNPNDPKGWILLARSQSALGRLPEALAAFERASALVTNDAQLFADYADTLVIAQQGRFEGKPQQLIARALKIDPNHLKSLALAGTAELRLGNRPASLKHWEKLQTLLPKDSDDFRQVQAIINDVKTGGGGIVAAAASAAPAPAPVAPPAGPAAPAAPGARVTGQIAIAPELLAKLAPTDVLFVLARAKEGPRMPLAVMRVPAPKAGEWPRPFELTDAMAMAPGMNLSAFAEVVIEARISKSGNAQLQPGDLSGQSDPVKSSASGVKVTIAKAAP